MTEIIDRKLTFDQQNASRVQGDIVRQGEIYPFAFELNGDTGSFTIAAEVKQYPGDTATVTPTVTYSNDMYRGSLSSSDTSSLAVGQWFIHIRATDSDEDIREPLKFYVAKGWI